MSSTKLNYLKKLWDDRAVMVQQDPIILKSGRESHIYINHRNFICLPANMDVMLLLFEEKIRAISNEPFALCNVHSSVSPILIGPLSIRMKIPIYFYRPVSGERGLYEDIFTYDYNPSSTFPKRLSALLIDDVVTTTTTIKTTAQSLREAGIDVVGSLMLVDRRIESEKREELIKIYPIVTLTEIIEYGMGNVDLSKDDKKLLEIELHYLQS